ncbi:hypothetical protein F4680DRAFT_57866 [Xylaria scruposa]|nr:hypothetical protein F4680DRAFT_57866 [Xylaria scruposa]
MRPCGVCFIVLGGLLQFANHLLEQALETKDLLSTYRILGTEALQSEQILAQGNGSCTMNVSPAGVSGPLPPPTDTLVPPSRYIIHPSIDIVWCFPPQTLPACGTSRSNGRMTVSPAPSPLLSVRSAAKKDHAIVASTKPFVR